MSPLDSFFKFKIGDTVRSKIHRTGFTADGVRFTPQIMVVVERMLTECYGGIQANYGCRIHTAQEGGLFAPHNAGGYNFLVALVALTEPELEPLELPPLTDEKPARRRVPRETESGDDNAAL